MTLTYYVGGKLVGQTVDFPPNLTHPEFTTFINSETFQEFILVSGVWEPIGTPPPPSWDYEEDFASVGIWLEQDASAIGIDAGNTRMDATYFRDGTNDAASIDMLGQVVSNTTWVWQNDWEVLANNTASDSFGIGNNPSSQGDRDGVHDFLGIAFSRAATLRTMAHMQDDETVISGDTQVGANDLGNVFSGFFTLARVTATTMNFQNFTDSARGSVERDDLGIVIPSTIQNLRFLRTGNNNASAAGGTFATLSTLLRFEDGTIIPPT